MLPVSSRQNKCRSSSKALTSRDLQNDGSPLFQKTSSTISKMEEPSNSASYRKMNSHIAVAAKSGLSRELFKENKQNYAVAAGSGLKRQDKEPAGIVNNSEYIKSLYRKYLGKEDIDRNTRPEPTPLRQSYSKQLNGSSYAHKIESEEARNKDSKRNIQQTSINRQSSSEQLVMPPGPPPLAKSVSRRQTTLPHQQPVARKISSSNGGWGSSDDSALCRILMEVGESENSCVNAIRLIKMAKRKSKY